MTQRSDTEYLTARGRWTRRAVIGATAAIAASGAPEPGCAAWGAPTYLTRDPDKLARFGLKAWRGWPRQPRFNGVQPLVREHAVLDDGIEPSWRPHCYGALAAADWPYADLAPVPAGIEVVHRFEVAGHGRASSGYAYGEVGYGDSAYWGMGGTAVPSPTAPDRWRSTGFDDRMINVPDDLQLRERCEWSARTPGFDPTQGDADEVTFWLYLPRRAVRGDDAAWPLLYSDRGGKGWGPGTIVYQNTRDDGGGFMLRDHGGRLDFLTAWQPAVPGATIVPASHMFDRWFQLRWRTVYHARRGRLQVWLDDRAVYDEAGPTLPSATSHCYAKFGVYTSHLGRLHQINGLTSRTAPRRNLYLADPVLWRL